MWVVQIDATYVSLVGCRYVFRSGARAWRALQVLRSQGFNARMYCQES